MMGYKRWRRPHPHVIRVMLVIVGIGLIILCVIAATQMKPMLTRLAEARVSNTVTGIVTESVNESINNGTFCYEDLISFEKDNAGKITAVKSNMPEFNRLQSKILDTVLKRISEVSTKDLSIPIGTLSGSALLAGRGPCITVRMQSIGSSSACLKNNFTSAGINQTKHQILLNIDVYVAILLPGFETATQVSNAFVVAETVIVGNVPDTYTYFDSTSSLEEDAEQHVLNGN